MSLFYKTAFTTLVFCITFLTLKATGAATIPEVEAGECLYLVGAPPGLPQATEEDRDGDAGIFRDCGNPIAGGRIDAHSENMLQAWIGGQVADRGGPFSCRAFAWTSHALRVNAIGTSRLDARITMFGEYQGLIDSGSDAFFYWVDAGAKLELQLLEEHPITGREAILATKPIFSRELPEGTLRFDSQYGQALSSHIVPGRIYHVRLYLEVWAEGVEEGAVQLQNEVDFGYDSPDRYARYDSIEVCLEEENDSAALLALVEELKQQNDDLAERIAEIQATVDDLGVKDCEIMRLLLTPQGLRSTACCEPPLAFPDGKDAAFCPAGASITSLAPDGPRQAEPPRRPGLSSRKAGTR